ncbi:hypothetical protein D9757_005995 [Collybiopsis confluens]|uniref:Flavin reductase like domain-containing protein n=1 Tax=Collybiopsis confluens TaxID=2823264 RepID=A0A8H5HUD5_9AGAR|nr:hypothetical protein D9757_005995 [Collybiopsis confluens]
MLPPLTHEHDLYSSQSLDLTTQYGQELASSCLDGLPPFEESSSYAGTSSSDNRPTVKYVQPPNPGWKYGDTIYSTDRGRKWMEGATDDNWVHHHTDKEDPKKIYTLLMSGVQPRPIAFVSSISADGNENLAPYSFFQVLCHSPPIMMISGITSLGVKDTIANIQATKDFTVNIISLPWIEQANAASVDAPTHISEWDVTGLTKEPSTHVQAARVKESAFSMECTLWDKYDVIQPDTGATGSTVIFGLIKCIHTRKDVLNTRGLVDPAKFQAMSRMGDISYGLVTEAFRLPRPSWTADGEAMERTIDKGVVNQPQDFWYSSAL